MEKFPVSAHWSILLHTGPMVVKLGPHITIDTGGPHAAPPPSPLILEFHFKNERRLHVILSCRRRCRPRTRALTPGVGGRVGGDGEVIYLLSVYSESGNHSSGTCPVFHLLLCLPQRPNSLGKA